MPTIRKKERFQINNLPLYLKKLEKLEKRLKFIETWMDPEGIMLSKISHLDKDKYHMISPICGI